MAVRSDGSAVSASAPRVRVAAPDGAHRAPPVGQRHPLLRLAMRALLVGFACFLSTETVASNLPPLFVSPVWPTNAILLCALVVTPVRHWWAYALAAFFSSVNHNSHTGAPFLSDPRFSGRRCHRSGQRCPWGASFRRRSRGIRKHAKPRCLSDRRRRCPLRLVVRGSPRSTS